MVWDQIKTSPKEQVLFQRLIMFYKFHLYTQKSLFANKPSEKKTILIQNTNWENGSFANNGSQYCQMNTGGEGEISQAKRSKYLAVGFENCPSSNTACSIIQSKINLQYQIVGIYLGKTKGRLSAAELLPSQIHHAQLQTRHESSIPVLILFPMAFQRHSFCFQLTALKLNALNTELEY